MKQIIAKQVKRFPFNQKAFYLAVLIGLAVVILLLSRNHLPFYQGHLVYEINHQKYSLQDFNFQKYLSKQSLAGKTGTLSQAELEGKPDGETTLRILLEDDIEANLKRRTAIYELAARYQLKLTAVQIETANNQVNVFIKTIGGNTKYKRMLNVNQTNERAIAAYYQSEALYRSLKEKIFAISGSGDLTEKEKALAKQKYPEAVAKFSYILFQFNDEAGERLADEAIEAKIKLAADLAKELTADNFEAQAKIKSEDTANAGTAIYLQNQGAEDGLSNAVFSTAVNQLSEPKTMLNGVVIIKRLAIDDGYWSNYLQNLREKKLEDQLKEITEALNVSYGKGYRKIEIK